MAMDLLSRKTTELVQSHIRHKRWYHLVSALACIVVFCTTYALILPAITLTGDAHCGMTEHTHSDFCYVRPLVCQTEENHVHAGVCYEPQDICICGLEETDGHSHSDACYTEQPCYICGQTEDAGHTHGPECWQSVQELSCSLAETDGHGHSDTCYTLNTSLICTEEHEHLPECYAETSVLSCTLDEIEQHHHGDTCWTSHDELVCTETERAGHAHTDACMGTELVLSCGMEEFPAHTHTADCMDTQLILICREPEGHIHTDGCYGEPELACGQTEHTHSESCFSDPGANVESAAVWERTLEGIEWTDEWPADVVAVAKSQLGYTESTRNYILDESGARKGYTRYGAWYGIPYGDWCAMYVSFCLHYAGVPEEQVPRHSGCRSWIERLREQELYYPADSDYEPQSGDIVFFDVDNCGLADHVGLVVSVEDGVLTSIEGNTSNCVGYRRYELGNERLYGYGSVTEAWQRYLEQESLAAGELLSASAAQVQATPSGEPAADGSESTPVGDGASAEPITDGETSAEPASTEPVSAEPASTEMATQEMPQYICGLEEHTHDERCYAPDGSFTCTQPEHTHDETCLAPMVMLTLRPEYFCGLEEHSHSEACWDTDGALICGLPEHTHDESCLVPRLSAEEMRAIAEQFSQQIAALEALDALSEEDRLAAEELMELLREAFMQNRLTEEDYGALVARLLALLSDGEEPVAEVAEGTNWIVLRDSGWFEAYNGAAAAALSPDEPMLLSAAEGDTGASSVQVDNAGGQTENEADGVSVSKTIAGTDLENVFDITLEVDTPYKIEDIIEEPDMAVVIVMDISNTMQSDFGNSTRYTAAMEAAEDFLDQFADNNSLGVSKIGYVAFNTDAHEIFGLQPCTTEAQATTLKNTMRKNTGNIINANDYASAHSRYTNMEAGLKMARDMLNGVSNKNKFVIFLSDGFPTTYVSSGYSGHDPIYASIYDDAHNYIRDDVFPQKPFNYGTNYSDRGAVKARQMAESMKNSGITIFSIGVDVGGQSLDSYITQSANNTFSTMDRTGESYDIGGTTTGYFTAWLKTSIGSGYYYDSTNTAGLKAAYEAIFEKIEEQIALGAQADWVATDPLPLFDNVRDVEFVGLYDKSNVLLTQKEDGTFPSLVGEHKKNAENTASFTATSEKQEITWDLKKSGYTETTDGDTTVYAYKLRYRVRLETEAVNFIENNSYITNGPTYLNYRVVEVSDGKISLSESRQIDFPIPKVHGYLGELEFTKVNQTDVPVAGAKFALVHDESLCSVCRGDNTPVHIEDRSAVSDANGLVRFGAIPSGHCYILKETEAPIGFSPTTDTWVVTVAYDVVTVRPNVPEGTQAPEWDGKVVNTQYYRLPDTGGGGTLWMTAAGLALMAIGTWGLMCRRRKRADET